MSQARLTYGAPVASPYARSARYCLVVVPTYNEAPNIERLIAAILDQGPQFDVLVVDDGSPDGTGDMVAALAARTPRVQLLRRPGKLGLGSAILEVAGLSFLGISGDPTEPEWGTMLRQAKDDLAQTVWPALGPGLAISLSILGFNILGDGLRDVLDPTR